MIALQNGIQQGEPAGVFGRVCLAENAGGQVAYIPQPWTPEGQVEVKKAADCPTMGLECGSQQLWTGAPLQV